MPKKNRLTPKKLTSVSLVDKGDNPEARVVIFKRKSEASGASDDGSSAVEKDDSGPSGDYECPLCGDAFDSQDALDSHTQSEHSEDDALEKTAKPLLRLLGAIGKKLGWSDEEVEGVAKDTLVYQDEDDDMAEDLEELVEGEGGDDDSDPDDPDDFDQALREQRSHCLMGAVYERVEALCSALGEQMDAGSDDSALQTTVDQFSASLKTAIPGVLSGVSKAGAKVSADRLQRLKDTHQQLGGLIDEVDPSKETANPAKGDSAPEDAPDDKEKKAVTKTDPIDKSALSPEVLTYVEELEKKASEAAGEDTDEDPILKGLEGQALEIMKGEIAKREALEARFAKMQDEREQEEMIRKVTSEFGSVPGTAREIAEDLRKMDEGTRSRMEAVLKASNQAIVEGRLYDELGSIGPKVGGNSAFEQLQGHARELMKADPSLTEPVAISKAAEIYPELAVQNRNDVYAGI